MPELKTTKRVVREVLRSEPSRLPIATAPTPDPEQALENAISAVTIDPAPAEAARAAKAVPDHALAYGGQARAAFAQAQAAALRGAGAHGGGVKGFPRTEIAPAAEGATALLRAPPFAGA